MGIQITEKWETGIVFTHQPPCPPFAKPQVYRVRVAMLKGGAVRVTRTLRETFLDRTSGIVVGLESAPCRVEETAEKIAVRGETVSVEINRESGALCFLNADGRRLLAEKRNQPCLLEEKPVLKNRFHQDGEVVYRRSIDGVRASSEDYETYTDRTAYEAKLSFEFDPDEGIYGFGSHEEGYGNLRGHMRQLYQHNMKAVVPVMVSTKGWGVLFDLSCLMVFHDDCEGSYLWADCADEMDYYFMGGGSYPAVMKTYADLTGHAPMMPKYAFGYVQSKERYRTAEELIDIVKEYRRRGVPLDVIVLDWCSWPEGQWGYKVFDRTRFPDPDALTRELHDLNARLMISIWPSMQGDANENRREMLENGCMLGNRTVYDAFRPEARQLYWKQANEGLFSHGIDAWWCDCSEPFESDWHGQIKPEPHERVRLNTEEARKYLDPALINAYSLCHSEGIYRGQRETTDRKRVLNLTRSSYAGQHRYATVTWSGDVSSTWEVLRRHVPEGVNFCVTGESYWSTDVGGFFPMHGGAWFGQGDYQRGVDDLGYRELFVRWMQYAAFLPVMRAHGTGTPREIWRFGEKGEVFYDALEKAICLRSRMVPYLYSLAAGYARDGMPLLLAPALVFPEDQTLRVIDDEMMLGAAILIKPVTRPMMYGPESLPLEGVDTEETVYLPAGCGWYTLDTEEFFEGGQYVRVDAPIDRIPAFVRAGAIVTMGTVKQYVDENPDAPLTVTVYPGKDAAFVLYDDAGNDYDYEKGEKAEILLSWNDDARTLTIGKRQGSFAGMRKRMDMLVRSAQGEPRRVQYEGEQTIIQL